MKYLIVASLLFNCDAGSFRRRRPVYQGVAGPFKNSKNILCPKGYISKIKITGTRYNTVIDCEQCPINTFQPSDQHIGDKCFHCLGGQTSPVKSFFCDGDICKGGQYAQDKNTQSCTDCPSGKYQNILGQFRCINCPSGTWQDLKGKNSCNNLENICPTGRYGSVGNIDKQLSICVTCPKGKYTSITGMDSCHTCPYGKYQPQEDQSRCIEDVDCSVGYYYTGNNHFTEGKCNSCIKVSKWHERAYITNSLFNNI